MSVKAPASRSAPQRVIDKLWKTRIGEVSKLGDPPSVLPKNLLTQMVGNSMPQGAVTGRPVDESYHRAVKECEIKIRQIVAESRRTNTKYCDPHFDLDDKSYCLRSLSSRKTGCDDPPCARRVGAIFEEPKFHFKRDVHVKDLRQGREGDCWFIASLVSLCVEERFSHLVERICPPQLRDEKVGVYGFVFHRDGEWISEIVDDKLYLRAPDYDDCDDSRRQVWDQAHSRLDPELSRTLYRRTFQTGSDALHFASCSHPQETWVPLLEKAFAKAHGDFDIIAGGWPGEGVEDLTGGIATEIISADVLDPDQLWAEFMEVNKEFLFGAGTRNYQSNVQDRIGGRQGIQDLHAYSVLRAVEYKGERLLLVKNPWGNTEWNGSWSDGSKEWTPEALRELDFTFGNEGIFWMPYSSFLERFVEIWRARLFTPDWNVSQHWTTIQVPWSGDYNDTEFEFEIPERTTTVIALSQLDERYFGGLKGQYEFQLAFRLHEKGERDDYIVRGYSSGDRSAVAELELEAGAYRVLLQVKGTRYTSRSRIEDVVKENWLTNRNKLIRIGLSYDLAHAKGQVEEEAPKKAKEATAARKEDELEEKKKDDNAEKNEVVKEIPIPNKLNEPLPDARHPGTVKASVLRSHGQGAPGEFLGANPSPLGSSDASSLKDDASDEDSEDDDDDDAQGENAPWDAPLVVSLRVFCRKTAATIRVVRMREEGVTAKTKVELDVDDPEKDASRVVPSAGKGEEEGEEGERGERRSGRGAESGTGEEKEDEIRVQDQKEDGKLAGGEWKEKQVEE